LGPEHPDALDAWLDAFRAGAPPSYLELAWPLMPEGLVWVEAIEGLPRRHARDMARAVGRRGDPGAAVVAYEHGRTSASDATGVPEPDHVRLLLGMEQPQAAWALAELGPEGDPVWLMLRSEAKAGLGDLEQAARFAERAANARPALLHEALRARARASGPSEALQYLERQVRARGVRPDARARLVQAELLLEAGEPHRCIAVLETHGGGGSPAQQRRSARLRQKCLDAR